MRLLVVTGAHGFLGRHVARAAAKHGARVVGLGHGAWRDEEALAWGLSAWQEGDVSCEALEQLDESPDAIVHCAGSGSAGLALAHPGQDFERTVGTTAEVLEFIRTRSPQTALVFPSSGAVYGLPAVIPVKEETPPNPISPYGVHKRIAEELIESYGRHFGVNAAIVRIFSLYGEELRKQLLWDACQKATRGQVEFSGRGTDTRDWVAAEDAAELLLLGASRATPDAPIANCATGIETTIKDVLTALFAALGVSSEPGFTGAGRSVNPSRYAGDPTRALAWGWQPKRSWQQGIAEYGHWFQTLSALVA
jgi:UDP-glucose 4-epimerase